MHATLACNAAAHTREAGLQHALNVASESCLQADPAMAFTLLVAADHSTPAAFGDHSHEPTPLTAAPLAAAAPLLRRCPPTSPDHFAELSQHMGVDSAELLAQAVGSACERERRKMLVAGGGAEELPSDEASMLRMAAQASADPVVSFDEISAAQGSLGRFPASEFMPLVRTMLGCPT